MSDGQRTELDRARGLTRRDLVFKGGVAGAGALSLGGFLAACGGDDEEPAGREATGGNGKRSDLKITSVSHGPPGDAFWAVYRKGIEDAKEDFGIEIEDVIPEEFNVQLVVDNLNSAIAAKPDAIFFTPTEPPAFEAPVRQAVEQGIRLIAVNVTDPRPAEERLPFLFYIGSSEELGGQVAAQRQLEERTPTRALCANHAPGHVGLEARCKGYTDVLGEEGVQVDKLQIAQDPTQAAEALRGYFTENQETDALFTLGPVGATPALQVLEEQGLNEKVIHSSFDLSQEQIDAIKNGTLLSTIGQQQYLQGYLPALFLALNVEHGFTLAGDVLTGPFLVDQSNVEEVEQGVKDGFF
jgi:simple sugar transport system substrate-binding protein